MYSYVGHGHALQGPQCRCPEYGWWRHICRCGVAARCRVKEGGGAVEAWAVSTGIATVSSAAGCVGVFSETSVFRPHLCHVPAASLPCCSLMCPVPEVLGRPSSGPGLRPPESHDRGAVLGKLDPTSYEGAAKEKKDNTKI